MAIIVALSRLPEEPAPGSRRPLQPAWQWAAATAIALAVGSAVVMANFRPMAADVAARSAAWQVGVGNWSGAAAAEELAVELWPVEPDYRRALGSAYLYAARLAQDPLPWLERAEASLLTARDPAAGGLAGVVGVAGSYTGHGAITGSRTSYLLAHAAYGQATALAPNHAMLYTSWGWSIWRAGISPRRWHSSARR